MLISNQFEKHPQAKLKPTTLRKFVKTSTHNFLKKHQTKKRIFILSSSWIYGRSIWNFSVWWVWKCSWRWYKLGWKVVKLSKLNEWAYEDLILSIDTNLSVRKVAFGLARNAKRLKFSKENCKIAWDRLVNKYALHTASSLMILKSEFYNSKLESIEQDLHDWISNLKESQIQMNDFKY